MADATDRPNTAMMLMVHRAFERDLGRLAAALAVHPTDPTRVDAIHQSWQLFHALLEHHHQAEDQRLWPSLLAKLPASRSICERMSTQHQQLDALLTATNEHMASWAASPTDAHGDDAAAGVNEITALCAVHLPEEESNALPLVADHLTAGDWERFTTFNMELNANVVWTMPWLAEGKPDEARAVIWSFVPDEVRRGAALEWSDSYSAMLVAAYGGDAPLVHPPG